MKTQHFYLVIMVLALMSASCKSEEQMAEQAAYAYSYAMANYQVDNAAEYATEETQNTTLIKARVLMKAVGESYVKSDTPAEIEITNLEMTSDTSAIATYHKTTPIKDMTGTLEMRKRDGKWLAHTPLKETKMPEQKKFYDQDGKEIKKLSLEDK
jgi:hypothetical protein